jgi:hypothetical protein
MKTWEDKTEMTIGIIEEGGEELLTSWSIILHFIHRV